jgi:hypothetical protein
MLSRYQPRRIQEDPDDVVNPACEEAIRPRPAIDVARQKLEKRASCAGSKSVYGGRAMANAAEIADQIRTNPSLRAKLLDNPRSVVNRVIPVKRVGVRVDDEIVNLREEVLTELAKQAVWQPEDWSMRHAEAVIRQFFDQAIRNPQTSFAVTVLMTCIVFITGLSFAIAGIFVGLSGDKELLGAVLVGSGVIGTLGALFAIARRGVDNANANHAQIRLILAGFASELGHLRALDLQTVTDVAEVNDKIQAALDQAVRLIHENVKQNDSSSI